MSALTDHAWHQCTLSTWRGDEARCRWCDRWLRGSRTRFCSLDCKSEAIANHAWATAKTRARQRDRACTRCGTTRRLHVHHRVPCDGVRTFSCHHHLTNLETLCSACHAEAHNDPEPVCFPNRAAA